MSAYQLALASTLLSAAGLSALITLFQHRRRQGRIVLSDEGDGFGAKDAFEDVVKPEDTADGAPVDEEGFWGQMKLRKAVLCIILLANAALLASALGWSFISGDGDLGGPLALLFRTIFTVYCLGRAFVWVFHNSVDSHWPVAVHLATLTSLEFFFLVVATILPEQAAGDSLVANSMFMMIGKHMSMAFSGLAWALCMTIPRGPSLTFPADSIYPKAALEGAKRPARDDVSDYVRRSIWSLLFFRHATKVLHLSNKVESLDITDLPVIPSELRATTVFQTSWTPLQAITPPPWFKATPESGWTLIYRLAHLNLAGIGQMIVLSALTAAASYSTPYFLQRLVRFLELRGSDQPEDLAWGWIYCLGLFGGTAVTYIVMGQLWNLIITFIYVRMRTQLRTALFAKTLVLKQVASTGGSNPSASLSTDAKGESPVRQQVMTLMTGDVAKVAALCSRLQPIIGVPVELVLGTWLLYKVLGSSAYVGLAVTCIFIPINRYASKATVRVQAALLKARDERMTLMNEMIGAIRMLKYMAWERNFQSRILSIRDQELHYRRLGNWIRNIFRAVWEGSPLLITLVAFYHYSLWRGIPLTPSVAFTAMTVFGKMRWTLNSVPDIITGIVQMLVSASRLEKYFNLPEVDTVPNSGATERTVAFRNATMTWPRENRAEANRFTLSNLDIAFPSGYLTLVCGKVGSGKSLLLQSLLGEAEVLAGDVFCPRSGPGAVALQYPSRLPSPEEWILPGVCAYVPQVAFLQNATIRDNILFYLPFDEDRYQQTLDDCALLSDLRILGDGDQTEIGERGITLSGGQKARISLARAVYSRASTLLLDDVLSAVDVHTAVHLFEKCIKGKLVQGRTVLLVSHHIQLCINGAAHVVALDGGQVRFSGLPSDFKNSTIMSSFINSSRSILQLESDISAEQLSEKVDEPDVTVENGNTTIATQSATAAQNRPKAIVAKPAQVEQRRVGQIDSSVVQWYTQACGSPLFQVVFLVSMVLGALLPVAENGWVRVWSGAVEHSSSREPRFYIAVFTIIAFSGVFLTTWRWMVLYHGSLRASRVLYDRLLERVLFARVRFHDKANRGRLLNVFGSDFEAIDSALAVNIGSTLIALLSVMTTLGAVVYVGGLPFVFTGAIIGYLYWNVGKYYTHVSREMQRLKSVSTSPLYSMYGETVSGIVVIRAFGASCALLREMLRRFDVVNSASYWKWSVNRWLSVRFNMLASSVIGAVGVICLLSPSIDAALAGFALAFASKIIDDLLGILWTSVMLQQSMVAVERVQDLTAIDQEPAEFIEPRPPAAWPQSGHVVVENLSVRYADNLPDVLHELDFEVQPGERVAVIGRTGSGKSTLAMCLLRMVDPSHGRILIDGLDIVENVGLTDVRSRVTIIPQEPAILSGTLRSTLDVFRRYEDAEIFEALRRVHLIPPDNPPPEESDNAEINQNIFRNLDSIIGEEGGNVSVGQRQLICMARAILQRNRIIVMDEATASIDYFTDERISQTIQEEFASSTVITIAHRLRTVINYDRVLVLDEGRIAEYDKPAVLLNNPDSKFFMLCKAAGKDEFGILQMMATSK
ncbi:multidrug resistance-associated ABC transporter [Auriculariales sp. MPI-PUGE-AT-0066]|nr:multidrug resistance-associated ABC transporter [Auriculariales sp. MPI-PUGE-AT-0066]